MTHRIIASTIHETQGNYVQRFDIRCKFTSTVISKADFGHIEKSSECREAVFFFAFVFPFFCNLIFIFFLWKES